MGIQALFDLLKRILEKNKTSNESEFIKYLEQSTKYNFSSSSIQASGIGRKDIRNALLLSSGLIQESFLKEEDLLKINEFTS